jgi:flavorubredoxin
MPTKYGSTYNAYFIEAPKITLVETVKHTHTAAYLERVKNLCNPLDIAYIVLNHTEPDHAGSVAALLDIAPNAAIVGSGRALAYIADIASRPLPHTMQVKDGDTLSLGSKTIRFVAAPNLHWPDSMYSYLEEEKALFTCDSFGAHYCFEGIMDDLLPNKTEYLEAFDYYFDCILRPFSKFMLKAIEKIRPLDIDVICPGHGAILRCMRHEMVERSAAMASAYLASMEGKSGRILVCYVSAYGYTRAMAEQIAHGIEQNGMEAALMDIEFASLGELESALTQADGLVVGSPTINQNTLLPVYKLFAAVNPLRDRCKMAAAFGSYGWSGEAADIIEANLMALGFKIAMPAFKNKFQPSAQTAQALAQYGKELADKMAV